MSIKLHSDFHNLSISQNSEIFLLGQGRMFVLGSKNQIQGVKQARTIFAFKFWLLNKNQFSFSEKATKIWKIYLLFWRYWVKTAVP